MRIAAWSLNFGEQLMPLGMDEEEEEEEATQSREWKTQTQIWKYGDFSTSLTCAW